MTQVDTITTSVRQRLVPVVVAVLIISPASLSGQAPTGPLDAVVAEALRNNLGLEQEDVAVDRGRSIWVTS